MTKRNASASVTEVAAMSDEQLTAAAWTLLTNNRQSGGGSIKGRALAQRRIRALGFRFYLGKETTTDGDGFTSSHNVWGMVARGEAVPRVECVEVGATLDHAAHKLGNGNAQAGWAFVWS